MNRRTLLQTSSAGAMLVIGIAAMANVFGHFVHFRWDASEGKIYSMSPASKRILRALPDPVVVKLFHSKELPPQIAVNRDYARDLLADYRSSSAGKLRVQLVQTDGEARGKEEAMREGIAPVRFDIIERDRRELREGFLGLTIQYRDKKEIIPFLQDVTSLEYDLTSRIKAMTVPAKPVLAFLTDHGALGPEKLDQVLRMRLESRFDLRGLELAKTTDEGIPQDVQTALIVGPESKYSERELWLLDQFLASGRSLGVAVDTKRVDMRAFYAVDNETGLPELLEKHGVKVLSTIVLDTQSQPIQIQMQQGMFSLIHTIEYPPFLIASSLSKEHVVTKGLDGLVMPFSSPIEAKPAKGKVEVLFQSTPQAWAKPDKTTPIMLNPLKLPAKGEGDLSGPFALAATIEGEFDAQLSQLPKGVKAKAPLTKALKPGRLAVIGTSKAFSTEFRVPPTNFVFMLNLMDWLALDADLIAIRNKTVGFRPLRDIEAGRKAAIRYSLILGPSLIAVLFGLVRWQVRRRRRDAYVAQFGPPPAPPAAEPPAPAEPAPVSGES